jgi:twitching motility protein PilT
MNIQELFDKTIENNASDLHLLAGVPPTLRIDGRLVTLPYSPLTNADIELLVDSIVTKPQKELFVTNRSLDFSFAYGGGDYGDRGRFRINLYYQRNTIGAAFRLLPPLVKSIEELQLPKICHNFAQLKQGLVLVTGPTGHGKSTTIASIISEINMRQQVNILTIEDPIEYMYPKGQSIISQRELGFDTLSWGEALRSALREDPDVVVIGEMRDPESIASAITIAETGHLVFSSLHTNSAAQSIDRIVDSFPEHQQNQVKTQLAGTLEGIISQRLIPKIDGGRIVATEVLMGTNAVRSNIREGKTHLLDTIIETSQDAGMISLESSLATLVKQGLVSLDVAQRFTIRPESFLRLIA